MLFERYPRYDSYDFTERKRAAYRRKLIREQGKYPLFPDLVLAGQLSVEEEGARRVKLADSFVEERRRFEANIWREARLAFFALDAKSKAAVFEQWRTWWGPRKALNFLYVVRKFGNQAGS